MPVGSRIAMARDREVELPVISTLRRKLLVSLALVGCMLLVLAISGIRGLVSYRNVIRDLDFGINQAPQQAELVAALVALSEPLLLKVQNEAGMIYQQREFAARLEEARAAVLDFRLRLERMPPSELLSGRRHVTDPRLGEIEYGSKQVAGLRGLEQMQVALTDPERRDEVLPQMINETLRLEHIALRIPDPVEGLSRELSQASRVYRSTFIVLIVATAIAGLFFVGLMRFGYVWIFDPIRKLHQGARRVAQGDFDYRVKLSTNDEMSELAEAFNMMTDRFQDIASDLDRQVRERSKQLVRSERLAGVGFLAAGVAHEINNPLSAIMMAAESLEERVHSALGEGSSDEVNIIRQYLQMIQRESDRCRQITGKLLDFARGQEATRARTDVTGLVSEVLDMVQHLGKYRDRKITFDPPGSCYLELNGSEIKQVFLNLVANGLDAMDPGGTMQITLTEQTDKVIVSFTDSGCGMTPEVIDNLFEPFFTQKKAGQGTGLGLSISHRIITEHGGTIEATSEGPGCGSTFRVCLPRRKANAGAAA